MLLQFNFKNFKSFRDDTTLDLTATKITEFDNHVVLASNEKVLPVAAIFGANASGKSNVVEAFKYMSIYVIKSLSYGGDADSTKKENERMEYTPFLFDSKSRNAESSFEVFYLETNGTGRTYNYGFVINSNGVCEEWLNYKTKSSRDKYKRVFYRNGSELDLSGLPAKCHENIRVALERETLIVSLGAKLKVSSLKSIRDWFINNEIVDFGEPYENLFRSRMLPDGFVEDKEVQKKVVNYFASFDSSIIGFDVMQVPGDDDKKHVMIDTVHKMVGSNNTATISLRDESAGTLKMFALYPMIQDVFSHGGILFVDELNARLHPLLVRAIVITFLNQDINSNHAQLVFTSHDTWQMNAQMLRRDEIWFAEKDSEGISRLYSLVDFVDTQGSRIRKDENYEKNYLLGKYGAIPSMQNFDVFKGE